MPVDNSHRQFILLASTLIENALQFKAKTFNGYLPKELQPPSYRRNSYLKERICALRSKISQLIPLSQAQAELAMESLTILDASIVLVDEILNFNVIKLYQELCPDSLMLGFFIRSVMRTLSLIERLTIKAIAGQGCEHWELEDNLQDLREEWSDVRADHNAVRLFLLVSFIQRNEEFLPRDLITEMVKYAQTNYASHCPQIYREALDQLSLGQRVDFPEEMHFLEL